MNASKPYWPCWFPVVLLDALRAGGDIDFMREAMQHELLDGEVPTPPQLTIDPTRSYQPTGKPKGPTRTNNKRPKPS